MSGVLVRLVTTKGRTIWEGNVTKADGVVLTIDDDPAWSQFEFTTAKLRVEGEGGGNASTWFAQLEVPRVKEPAA